MHCACAHFTNSKRCEHTVAIGCINSADAKVKCEELVASLTELQRRAATFNGIVANCTDAALAIKQYSAGALAAASLTASKTWARGLFCVQVT